MTLHGTARCLSCGVLAEGDPQACDKAAAKHVAVGHATAVEVRPC